MTLLMAPNQQKNVIIAILKSESVGKLINRIPSFLLLISSLPGSAFRTHVDRSARLAMSTIILRALPGKLDIKRHSPSILYVFDISSILLYTSDILSEDFLGCLDKL